MTEFRKLKSTKFLYEIDNKGNIRNVKSKHILKWQIFRGYAKVTIFEKHIPIARLVLEAWGPEKPSPLHEIDHIDRNPLNNNIENLRWVTKSENLKNRDFTNIHPPYNTERCHAWNISEKNRQNLLKVCYEGNRKARETIYKNLKRIKRTNLNTNSVIIYKNIIEAAQACCDEGISNNIKTLKGAIRRVCKKERKVAYNCRWEYITTCNDYPETE